MSCFCGDPVHAKNLCNRHYLRRWKYGSLDLPEQLTGRDLLHASIEIVEDCWLFVGMVAADSGYGRIGHEYAHRISYQAFVGPIPDGLHIDHVKSRGCLSRLCINPAHLEAVTQQENNRRVTAESCRKGHPWTEENTYVCPDGRRFCRTCQRIRSRKRLSGVSVG